MLLNILLHFYYYITVSLTKKPCSLFGLKLVKNYLVRACIYKIIKVQGLFPFMNLTIITLSSLQGRRNLHAIYIPGFDLCLHQKIKDTIKFLGQNPQIAYFRLVNYRLRPTGKGAIVCLYTNPFNRKKTTGTMS